MRDLFFVEGMPTFNKTFFLEDMMNGGEAFTACSEGNSDWGA
jgi:hypothetical protein